ncbi:unnamed protein product [Linum trigynum]|uniref:C2H2-type domain-containing protein n=1 Tax=Linum trigynum TaxID=586398 RepID=A0AAV2DHF5_9ROSI
MQFWGVEVKSGEPLPVQCGDDFILHLSQATLGECKKDKGNGSVSLSVKVGGKKLVLGTLYPEKVPQLQFDLVFERDFELSHTGKNGSVYFMGYKVREAENEDSELEMEPLPAAAVNGGPISLTNENKPAKREKAKSGPSGTKHVQIIEPKKDDEESDDDSSDEDRWLATQGKPIEAEGESDEDDDDDEDSDDEEETDEEELADTKKDTGKKRSAPEAKTPAPSKKTKLVTPQKTGGKKAGEHQATPHPAKQASKTASTSDSKSHVCKSCDRTFGSDNALQSHTKAKHGDAK